MRTYTWKKLELAILLGLSVTLLWGAVSLHRQETLSRKMIRLHVIANSDSDADQALKLRVRDAVLTRATELLTQLPPAIMLPCISPTMRHIPMHRSRYLISRIPIIHR